MGMKVNFNPSLLEASINQIGDRAVKGMAEKMRKTAIRIRDLAREFAPVKTGLLEDSIDYSAIQDGRRKGFVIFIDLDAARRGGNGQLGDYAEIMENELHPYGRQKSQRYFRLGPGSLAKAASGRKVGGRFLSRAIKQGTQQLVADMVAEVARTTRSTRVAPVNFESLTQDSDE